MQTQSSIERLLKLNPPPPGIDPEFWADELLFEAEKRQEHVLNMQALREHRLWLIEKKRAARMAQSEE